jgi:hypothetical protein
MVPADQAAATVDLLSSFHPGATLIGSITDEADVIELPDMRVRAAAGSDQLTQL